MFSATRRQHCGSAAPQPRPRDKRTTRCGARRSEPPQPPRTTPIGRSRRLGARLQAGCPARTRFEWRPPLGLSQAAPLTCRPDSAGQLCVGQGPRAWQDPESLPRHLLVVWHWMPTPASKRFGRNQRKLRLSWAAHAFSQKPWGVGQSLRLRSRRATLRAPTAPAQALGAESGAPAPLIHPPVRGVSLAMLPGPPAREPLRCAATTTPGAGTSKASESPTAA